MIQGCEVFVSFYDFLLKEIIKNRMKRKTTNVKRRIRKTVIRIYRYILYIYILYRYFYNSSFHVSRFTFHINIEIFSKEKIIKRNEMTSDLSMKGVIKVTNETTILIKQALHLIADFINREYNLYSHKVDPERMYNNNCYDHLLDLAYTELGPNNEYPVQVMVDINHCKMVYMIVVNGSYSFHHKEYKDLKELIDRELSCLNFDDLIGECKFYLERELGKEI